ncbi:alpha/beta fold hydrolase [Desulfocurvibacter africanus]|uniref:Alpha/beta hydrolase fold protein n=1 Tax=Desulfocurvibacter africanus subsp. africanus str. Walvis Bay TaxID=690850 RepID=F3YWF3_DESAF|nr:alpha/beta hydrolase [Desulfocurvibacter africanus]EGJ49339.1 alpha/beta hydrolase fold protein [Desulfocurvibacter africanus subsp. africanus str. Walvis Bay]
MTEKPPILFIPGWGATGQAWDGVRNELPGSCTHVLGWIEALRDESAIAAALSSRSEPWLLVGWSLGALLALRAALKLPALLRGLVLVSGTARMCADQGYPGADPRALRAMRARLSRDPERVLSDFAGACLAPDGDEALRAHYLDQARRFSAAELTQGLDALARLNLRAQAATLAVPTLLIHGKRDAIIPVESARALAEQAPGASLEILEHRGHALPFTAPLDLARLIRNFTA